MGTKLYVGNLSYDTTEDELRNLFSKVGTVSAVDVIKDRDTGRSKGFAFVTMGSQTEASQAIQQINGQSLGGRDLRVSEARPPEDRGRSGGGGYGSYGGNRDQDRRRPGGGGGPRRY